jgi:uncharacterized protein YsxB (DUF464 family)
MIRLEFYSEGSRISGFMCEGHSGLDDAGRDVLCAAVTGAIRLIENAINDVLGTGAAVKVNENVPRIELRLPPESGQEQEDAAQALLAGLMLLGVKLHDEYPDNIEVSSL